MLSLPRVIGHRGAAGSAPENTLAGLRRAAALGATWVEIDVQLTADGAVVLLHDLTLDRTTSGAGPLAAARLDDLARLDAGAWFGQDFVGEPLPTLDQAVDQVLSLDLGLNVEIKSERGRAEATGRAAARRLLERWPADRPAPLISAGDPAALAGVRDVAPHLPRALVQRRPGPAWTFIAAELRCTGLVLDHRHLGAATCAHMAREATRILGPDGALAAYTVNDPERAARLHDWGARSVFSDHPERMTADRAPERAA